MTNNKESKVATLVQSINNKIASYITLHNSSNSAHSSLFNSKLNISDIKDNLTSTDVNKPLSANQGRLLRLMNGEPMILKVQGNSFEEYNNSTALQGSNIVVDYGDGTIESLGTKLRHEYIDGNNHTIKIYNVTSLGTWCFQGCSNLTSINIPENFTLGESCFTNCTSLTSIDIPKGVNIPYECFKGCTSLTSININEGVSLQERCFYNCTNLTSIIIPEGATSIGTWCFKGCSNLTSIVIPESVTSISSNGFNGCAKLTNYTFNWNTPPINYSSATFPNVTNTNSIINIPYGTTANYVTKRFPSNKLQEASYIKTSEETTDSITDNDFHPVTSNAVNDALNTKASTATANSNTNGLMSSTDKSKLDDMTTVALEVTYTDGSSPDTFYLVKRSGGS